ncbi:glycosyltransferase family 61 protein [Paracoccus sp. TOH]|uniref:glycosyltransferase 61 family protein n=1 Tax=Paracoccus sp. TOH TaxID=1263728 RepID=UPI0025AEF9E7|nr:glycosyltransferase family 61 protein [Paracoccus sp. TOH]WJS84616.1 glycosyltransferase family 61 protein [Paracoccus sp. TOH]
MKIDLARPPMSVFHMPGLHPGLSYLPPRPGWIMRPTEGARVRLFAESDDPALRGAQQNAIDRQQQRALASVMEINCAPVLLEDATFRHGFAMIGERVWLNGAAGGRMRTRYDQKNPDEQRQSRLHDAFRRARRDADLPLPVWKELAEDLPIAIELKNGFNYYHFTVETLGCLAAFADDDSGQPINLHLPQDEVRDFIPGFIAAVFPGIADRVAFVTGRQSYERVRAHYSHRHYLYQTGDERILAAIAEPGVDPRWADQLRSKSLQRKAVFMASYDSSLRLLREHALRQLPGKLVEERPRLVWMGRDEAGDARARGITGHKALLAELSARGFRVVAFEHLSPLEQIAQMQAADILIAPHGAGLANMVYARPGALVIEIGTRQTQLHRWGDFLPAAHVSRCRYDTVFADIAGLSDLGQVPPVSEGLLGVHVGRNATRRILELVDEALAQDAAP